MSESFVLQKFLLLGALFAVTVTLLVTPVVVGVFRRKVTASMNRAAHAADPLESSGASLPTAVQQTVQPVLPRVRAGDALVVAARESSLAQQAQGKLRRIALAYVAGGVAQAVVIALVLLLGGASAYTSLAIGLPVVLMLSLPVVPTVSQVLSPRPAVRALWAVGGLVAALLLAGAARGLVWSIFQLYILIPAVIFAIFNLRYWRAAAPLILVLAFGASLGWLVFLEFGRLIVGDSAGIWLFRLAGLAGGTLLALPVARHICGWYESKRSSEQMLSIDIWWLLLTLIETTILVITRDSLGQLIALGGFAAYWLVSRALIGGRRSEDPPAARLLLLRVFGHGRRSERLLDELTLRWRPVGTVALIAGPDLALRNIDPSELYGFLTGSLAREFVKDGADLAQRLARLDERQDPDGLYRVTQFFCHRNTWQRTLDALVAGCDAILMDLRGFDESRLGCQYEIGRLAECLGEKPIVLLVDASTRVDLAESLFLAAVPASRRAALPVNPHVFVLEAGRSPGDTVATATRLLFGAQPA
jgi:hypothetical protein